MDSKSDSEEENLDLQEWKTDKKQIVVNILENAQNNAPKLNFKRMTKLNYEKEYEKYRRYKKYKRKYKELKDFAPEWEKCQEAEKKRKDEEEVRRKYIAGNQVNRDEIKKKLSSQHQSSTIHKNEKKDKDKTIQKFEKAERDKKKEKEKIREKIKERDLLNKDKEREKAAVPQIKREKELPVDDKPYTSSFKALMKKEKLTSHEKRPMEKYMNQTKKTMGASSKSSSREKAKNEMSASDVMKQMFQASKIGEQGSGSSFKIPKKAVEPAKLKFNPKREKFETDKRVRDANTPIKRDLSPRSSPSSSEDSNISSSESESSDESISSPNRYRDISPLPLPDSPPASPDSVKGKAEHDGDDIMESSYKLINDIKPLSIYNIENEENLIEEYQDEETECVILDSIEDTKKYYCQLCDLFDKDGTTKTKSVLHILKNHLQGFSYELDMCQSLQAKIEVYKSDTYATMIQECRSDDSLYQPVSALDENITRWKCLKCSNSLKFKNEVEAERHVAMEHYARLLVPVEWFPNACKIFECSEVGCSKQFESYTGLVNHEVLQHDALKAYLGKVFKNDYLLKTNIPKKRLRN